MKILIVAATWMEINMLVDELEYRSEKEHFLKEYQLGSNQLDILITGIGPVFTTFHLTNTLQQQKYQLVLNVGIAGSLTRDLKIGEVVNVVTEEFADLGIENKQEFLTLFEAGFIDRNEFPFNNGLLKASDGFPVENIKNVRGITASKSHGSNRGIADVQKKFLAHVESMEGAAVFYVCNWWGVNCYEIRAISNYVEPRDSSNWNIPLALENLKDSILKVLETYSVPVN
ncbi:MAG: futalosine hydrolase [Prolixibacteraceae bacterium]|nr:futalosine hydrolase [Prolixibacteraceae bacterium]